MVFLVRYNTPSNSNTRFSSISILAVNDSVVSSSCGFVFGVTGAGVSFTGDGMESVFFLEL